MTKNVFNPFPDSFKQKDVADDNFKLDENGRKFTEKVENTEEKGEISHSVFKRLVLQTRKNQGPYSPTILKNNLCLFLQDFVNLNATQLLIG